MWQLWQRHDCTKGVCVRMQVWLWYHALYIIIIIIIIIIMITDWQETHETHVADTGCMVGEDDVWQHMSGHLLYSIVICCCFIAGQATPVHKLLQHFATPKFTVEPPPRVWVRESFSFFSIFFLLYIETSYRIQPIITSKTKTNFLVDFLRLTMSMIFMVHHFPKLVFPFPRCWRRTQTGPTQDYYYYETCILSGGKIRLSRRILWEWLTVCELENHHS